MPPDGQPEKLPESFSVQALVFLPSQNEIDSVLQGWDAPTMKILTVDAKRRLILPGASPGECYAVREAGTGHYELAKVVPAAKTPKPTPAEVDALLASFPLTPSMTSNDLRTLTREP